jgi:hypothetical protein
MLGAGYAAGDEHRPLGGYALLRTIFAGGLTAALVAGRRRGRPLPEIGVQDVLLGGIATHKLARLIAKDKVTSFLRAPFTRFQEKAGHGELDEQARGGAIQLAYGAAERRA